MANCVNYNFRLLGIPKRVLIPGCNPAQFPLWFFGGVYIILRSIKCPEFSKKRVVPEPMSLCLARSYRIMCCLSAFEQECLYASRSVCTCERTSFVIGKKKGKEFHCKGRFFCGKEKLLSRNKCT